MRLRAPKAFATVVSAAAGWSAAAADDYVSCFGHLRLDQVQYIATHNSYHLAPGWPVMSLLDSSGYQSGSEWSGKRLARALDYTHLPLTSQLALGLRAFELDVHDDPDGGRFAGLGVFASLRARGLPSVPPSGAAEAMKQPGFKVFHQTGYDQLSTCRLLRDCLGEIARWSAGNPGHAPIVLFIEVKTGASLPVTPDYFPVASTQFRADGWRRLEDEIVRAVTPETLFTPRHLRSQASAGWPSLRELAGKVLVLLLDSEAATREYRAATGPERLLFTAERPDAGSPLRLSGSEHWAILPEPRDPRITVAAGHGLLTFTRADADTEEARAGDQSRRDVAFASGATFISTDYPYPDHRLSIYAASFEGGEYVRCNPKRADCTVLAKPRQIEPAK